jgi:hypothetical protein
MSLSDFEHPWMNSFENQTLKNLNENDRLGIFLSDLHQPCPQRSSFDGGSGKHDCCEYDEHEDHHLEQALKDMVASGELESFLRDNTISLSEIQDDTSIRYGSAVEMCDFGQRSRVRRHSIGSVDEVIKCPFPGCDKIFNRSYNFKSHLKIHSGEKPFRCNHCELSFARCHDMRRHEKIHKREFKNLNKCDFCNKTFSRPDALNRHIKLNCCQNILLKRD